MIEWDKAVAFLRQAEPALAPVFDRFAGERLTGSGDDFQTLANAIVGQQISVKAAETIWGRLKARLGQVRPQAVLDCPVEELRAAGLSARKAEYLVSLAQAFLEQKVHPARWPEMDDEAVLAELVSLRGIGRWTAEMFLIFHLERPDVLPLDDIGLLRSAGQLFGWERGYPAEQLRLRAEAWRPWRTVAVWYLWRQLDPLPVVY